MKTIGWTLRASLVAAILATVSNSFALEGLFDSFKRGTSDSEEYVVDDGSFFGGEALTIGETSAPYGDFASSDTNGTYSGCAGCSGGGIPASIDCGTCCDPCAFPCDPCATGWTEYPAFSRPYRPFRPVRNILSGVKNFLFGSGYRYCQPAYVCDPCWTVCDDCCWSPCASCDFGCETSCCGGNEVYAPRGCCGGDGFAPGETRELNPQTGLPGIDSSVSPTPTPLRTNDANSAAPERQPAIPASQPVPAANGYPEPVPTPAADSTLGSGVLQMLVPEDAVVYVNGYRTRQTGTLRSFAANNLEYGETYSFEIRVVAVRDGRRFEDVQRATLNAGDSTALAFNLSRVRDNEAVAVNR